MRRAGFGLLILVVAPLLLMSAIAAAGPARKHTPLKPQIPTANRNVGKRVFLEHADVLHKVTADSFMVLEGNVHFTKGAMNMYCDSAHYYPDTESLDAFGNVKMEQGDTLFVYADELNYSGPQEIAYLYANFGKKVKLINRDVKLETDVFTYDLATDLGYYNTGGVLYDKKNRLTSIEGEYVPSTKEANFYSHVHLNSRDEKDTLDIYTDTLYYNTDTHIAELYSPSEVINERGVIYTREGVYNTDTHLTNLYDRSLVVMKDGQTLQADTIFYDRNAGYGEAFGNMILTDSVHSAIITGEYGFYDEKRDSSFVTGRARLMEFSKGDTIYAHGRYIESFLRIDSVKVAADTVAGTEAYTRVDSTHIAVMYPRVRFFRSDAQGICDSLRFTERDSLIHMYINPVIWSNEQQIFGNVIVLHVNDSTIDRAVLPDFGFAAKHIEDIHYNQLSGKSMTAYLDNGELRHLDIDGNVEIIMYPEENDSTINKVVNTQSSFLAADFKDNSTERIKMWPETTGTVTPLFMAKKSLFRLSKFQWFEDMRPADKDDIFVIPQAMEDLMVSSGRAPTPKPQPLAALNDSAMTDSTNVSAADSIAHPTSEPSETHTPTQEQGEEAPAPDDDTPMPLGHDAIKPADAQTESIDPNITASPEN